MMVPTRMTRAASILMGQDVKCRQMTITVPMKKLADPRAYQKNGIISLIGGTLAG